MPKTKKTTEQCCIAITQQDKFGLFNENAYALIKALSSMWYDRCQYAYQTRKHESTAVFFSSIYAYKRPTLYSSIFKYFKRLIRWFPSCFFFWIIDGQSIVRSVTSLSFYLPMMFKISHKFIFKQILITYINCSKM